MKASELRGKNGDELQKELEALLQAQFGLRMQHRHAAARQHQPAEEGAARHRARAHHHRKRRRKMNEQQLPQRPASQEPARSWSGA